MNNKTKNKLIALSLAGSLFLSGCSLLTEESEMQDEENENDNLATENTTRPYESNYSLVTINNDRAIVFHNNSYKSISGIMYIETNEENGKIYLPENEENFYKFFVSYEEAISFARFMVGENGIVYLDDTNEFIYGYTSEEIQQNKLILK